MLYAVIRAQVRRIGEGATAMRRIGLGCAATAVLVSVPHAPARMPAAARVWGRGAGRGGGSCGW